MAYIAYANGERKNLAKVPNLEEAQKIVGGYVEVVYPRATPGVVLLIDEEGRLKTSPINEVGSALYGDIIVGDIVVMTRKEAKPWR